MKTRKYNTPTPRYLFETRYFLEWVRPRCQFLFLAWLIVMGFLFLYTQNYNEMLMLDAMMRERGMNSALWFRVMVW
uniref:Uncharacterized protein n=1 Tax=viral metagenome TaxID=1070528 RepID=A0A6H1ZKZ7_9ZZZZ